MKQEAKILLGIGVLTVVLLVGAIFLLSKSSSPANTNNSPLADPKLLIKDDSHKIASSSAKVNLVEFGDYQCPACGAAHPIVKRILEDYSGRINFIFRNFPLAQHKNALIAAEVAEAAGEQGKYWEMYNKLYENQTQWSESKKPIDIFITYGKDLGLDTDKFKKEIEGSKFADRIRNDQNDGFSLGVNSTPTFFLNQEKIVGVPTYDQLKSKVDSALTKNP